MAEATLSVHLFPPLIFMKLYSIRIMVKTTKITMKNRKIDDFSWDGANSFLCVSVKLNTYFLAMPTENTDGKKGFKKPSTCTFRDVFRKIKIKRELSTALQEMTYISNKNDGMKGYSSKSSCRYSDDGLKMRFAKCENGI